VRAHAAFALLFFSARNFAHRAFVALEIFARAAADTTRFLICTTSRPALLPNALAAARTPFMMLQLAQLFFELSFFTLDCCNVL
jgi:hypothetical protein